LTRIVNVGLVIFLAVAMLSLLCLNLGSTLIVSTFLSQAPAPLPQVVSAFRWVTVAIALNLLTFPLASVVTGLQRFDLTSVLSSLNLIATASLVALFLASGAGILGLAYAMALASASNVVLHAIMTKRLLPDVRIAPELVRIADVKSLFSFSVQLYVIQISIAVSSHAEKFLLARFVGLTGAGWYEIANDLAARSRSVSSLMLAPLLPAATELETLGNDSKLAELYGRTQKYLAFVNVLLFAALVSVAHRFVALWLGQGFTAVPTALIVLTGAGFVVVATAPGVHLLTAKGLLREGVRAAVLTIVLNLVVSTLLILYLGFAGAVYGTALALITATCYFVTMFHKRTGYSLRSLWSPYPKPMLWAGFLAVTTWLLVPVNHLGWSGLLSTLAAFAAAYCIGLVLLRYFDAFDVDVLERILPLPKALRRILLFAQ